MISDDARYCGSKMILNPNEPSKLEDTSWIKPMKYVGFGGNACWKSTGILQAQNATNLQSQKLQENTEQLPKNQKIH
jgi:hypothetical protein